MRGLINDRYLRVGKLVSLCLEGRGNIGPDCNRWTVEGGKFQAGLLYHVAWYVVRSERLDALSVRKCTTAEICPSLGVMATAAGKLRFHNLTLN